MNIDGFDIETETREFNSANILHVTAGTNCPKGGDAGHGGRTLLVLNCGMSTDFKCNVSGNKVELVFRGDSECETLADGLEFAAKTLKRRLQANEITSNR